MAISLSADAMKMLRHFKEKGYGQRVYELPGKLLDVFGGDAEVCEAAQEELASAGFLELGDPPPRHIPLPHRIRAAALTLDGERYVSKNPLA